MTEESHQEYDDDLVYLLESVWGEGYLSPGGPEEVEKIVGDLDLSGKTLLDIGCGSGGISQFLLNRYHPERVTGIDVEKSLIETCKLRAKEKGLSEYLDYIHVAPGPVPIADESFDVVFTKDSLIHIEDKNAICSEVFRLLRPGGFFIASDWMSSDAPLSAEMKHYINLEDLGFGIGHQHQYRSAMEHCGFSDIMFTDRNKWYQTVAKEEHRKLSGELYPELVNKIGKEFADHEIQVWAALVVVLERGELRPTHWRAYKPC